MLRPRAFPRKPRVYYAARMEFSAKGLRVLVTAGAAGIGRVIARTFVEHGARVHICDIDEKALAGTKKQLPTVSQTRGRRGEASKTSSGCSRT